MNQIQVINETDNLCSPRGTQNLVGTKQTRSEEKRGKFNLFTCHSG